MLKRKKERRDDKTMKQSPWMITVIGMCIVWLIVSVVFGVTWQALVAVLFVLFIASILFNSFWLRKFSRQVQDLMPLLVQKRYGEFIAGNEQLLKGKSSPLLQAILLMNIATAYGEMGQYDTALSTLDQISPKGLAGTNLAIFHGKKPISISVQAVKERRSPFWHSSRTYLTVMLIPQPRALRLYIKCCKHFACVRKAPIWRLKHVWCGRRSGFLR